MAKTASEHHRYRFNVPDEDETVIAWMAAQSSPSVALRLLIKEDINETGGISDVLSRTADKLPSARKRRSYTLRNDNVPQNESPPAKIEGYAKIVEPVKKKQSVAAEPENEMKQDIVILGEATVSEPPAERKQSFGKLINNAGLNPVKQGYASDAQNGGLTAEKSGDISQVGQTGKSGVNKRSAADMGLM